MRYSQFALTPEYLHSAGIGSKKGLRITIHVMLYCSCFILWHKSPLENLISAQHLTNLGCSFVDIVLSFSFLFFQHYAQVKEVSCQHCKSNVSLKPSQSIVWTFIQSVHFKCFSR